MKCQVCGMEYGLSHNCSGIAPLVLPEEMGPPPKLRFAPFYYLDEAFKILIWDDAAVRRASKDNNSLVYGLAILIIATAIPFLRMVPLLFRDWQLGYPLPWGLRGSRYAQTLGYTVGWTNQESRLMRILDIR